MLDNLFIKMDVVINPGSYVRLGDRLNLILVVLELSFVVSSRTFFVPPFPPILWVLSFYLFEIKFLHVCWNIVLCKKTSRTLFKHFEM